MHPRPESTFSICKGVDICFSNGVQKLNWQDSLHAYMANIHISSTCWSTFKSHSSGECHFSPLVYLVPWFVYSPEWNAGTVISHLHSVCFISNLFISNSTQIWNWLSNYTQISTCLSNSEYSNCTSKQLKMHNLVLIRQICLHSTTLSCGFWCMRPSLLFNFNNFYLVFLRKYLGWIFSL